MTTSICGMRLRKASSRKALWRKCIYCLRRNASNGRPFASIRIVIITWRPIFCCAMPLRQLLAAASAICARSVRKALAGRASKSFSSGVQFDAHSRTRRVRGGPSPCGNRRRMASSKGRSGDRVLGKHLTARIVVAILSATTSCIRPPADSVSRALLLYRSREYIGKARHNPVIGAR